jgi:hypothetical protein
MTDESLTIDDAGASPLEQIRKLWAKLGAKEREEHLDWALHQCTTCGRDARWTMADGRNRVDGLWLESCWCDACCERGMRGEAAP